MAKKKKTLNMLFPKHCLKKTFMKTRRHEGNTEHAILNIDLHEKCLVSLARKTNCQIIFAVSISSLTEIVVFQ